MFFEPLKNLFLKGRFEFHFADIVHNHLKNIKKFILYARQWSIFLSKKSPIVLNKNCIPYYLVNN